jgi:uncharacterized FlgJ-related protein
MAKKKELPKAMMGKIIKPMVRAVAATGRVAGKSTVRGAKAFGKSATNTSVKDFLKGSDIKAGVKGFARGVKSGIKTEKAKAAERVVAEKAKVDKAKLVSEEKRLMDDLNAQKTNKTTSGKKPMSPQMKKRIKQAVVIGTVAAAAGIKYANRPRRTLND